METSREQVEGLLSKFPTILKDTSSGERLSILATITLITAIQELTYELSEIALCMRTELPELRGLRKD